MPGCVSCKKPIPPNSKRQAQLSRLTRMHKIVNEYKMAEAALLRAPTTTSKPVPTKPAYSNVQEGIKRMQTLTKQLQSQAAAEAAKQQASATAASTAATAAKQQASTLAAVAKTNQPQPQPQLRPRQQFTRRRLQTDLKAMRETADRSVITKPNGVN
jgi:aminoglycoside phosphotransferase (APT) family kinase protein